jgi:hypothetical protein
MANQTVIWTALPGGTTGEVTSRRLRLSVFVSPRLISDEPGATLAQFPDFLSWPERLAAGNVDFHVQTRATAGASPDQAVLARVVSPAPDPDLWQALFTPATPVESHTPDTVGTLVNTYSASGVHQQLRQGHLAVAAATPVAVPTRADLDTSLTVTKAFQVLSFAAGEQPHPVIQAFAPSPNDDTVTLNNRLQDLATHMFRPDGSSSLGQRVASALLHARELSQRTPGVMEVLPRVSDETGTPAASDLARLAAFTRGPVLTPTDLTPPGAPASAAPAPSPAASSEPITPLPPLDFHRYLTMLADHPTLLRRLGLVVDLEIPAGSIPSSPGTGEPRLVQVIPGFTEPLAGPSVSPFTAYVLTGEGQRFFAAAPAVHDMPEIVHGLLMLSREGQDAAGDAEYDLVQVDVQGGGLKLINALADRTEATPGPGTDDIGGLPALRTSGVSVVRADHGRKLLTLAGSAAGNNTAIEQHLAAGVSGDAGLPVLHAEDLVRGYRFDVFDSQARSWRSLHARIGTYQLPAHPAGPTTLPPVTDEGAIQFTAVQPYRKEGIDPAAELYVSESLMQWDGWSLAAARPGRTIMNGQPAVVTNAARPVDPQLVASFEVAPGTLPQLRFGRSYRLRARAVDLAGNGLAITEADDMMAEVFPAEGLPAPTLPPPTAPELTYSRFEPVATPVLVPRERVADGESLQRLVIRSRAGVPADQEAAELTSLVAARLPGASYRATCERHLVPPKTSLQSAERHGLLDPGSLDAAVLAQTYHLARKEKGRLTDTSIIDVTTGEPVALADPAAVEIVSTGPRGGYVVNHEEQLTLPYLPDPLARAASLCGLPGVTDPGHEGVIDGHGLAFIASGLPADVLSQLGGPPVRVPFHDPAREGDWPHYLPFRLMLSAIPPGPHSPPQWDAQARLLTVFLPPAEQAKVRLSCALEEKDLLVLGQWRWLLDADPQMHGNDVAVDVAVHGGRWQLTPPQTLTLVHAVEAPLRSPDFSTLTAPRARAATFTYLTGDLPIHGKSTAKVDVLASWQDPGDHAGAPATPASQHVLEIPVNLPGEDLPATTDDPGVVPIAGYDPAGDVLHLDAPAPDDQSGRAFSSRHEFGDTRHRMVTYQAIATSRFRDCFPAEITDQPGRVTLTGTATTVDVPSSAPPAAPVVVSVLPTFTWSREEKADGSRVSRRTGGIRVYLRPPWYSSGDGEQLAVVLADPAQYPPADPLRTVVSHWGRDPVWVQTDPMAAPAPSDFPAAVTTRTQVPVEEMPSQLVTVAGHDVGYDQERDLLVCDIAINPTPPSYFPFARLALARFQPHSIPGTELSRVVLADYVLVPPERTVTVTPGPTPGSIRIEVTGFTAIPGTSFAPVGQAVKTSPAPAFFPLVTVEVQQRELGTDPDVGWRTVPGAGGMIHTEVFNQSPTLWGGTVTLPADRAAGQFRIVIRERESVGNDAAASLSELRVVFAEILTP